MRTLKEKLLILAEDMMTWGLLLTATLFILEGIAGAINNL